MASDSLIFPAGTEQTHLITLPVSGSWCGLTRARISTHTANAVLHQWEYISNIDTGPKIAFRRVGPGPGSQNWYNFTLYKEQELGWWSRGSESLLKITFTSTYPISLNWESTRYLPRGPGYATPVAQWNKQADAKPWVTNLTPNNSTELPLGDQINNPMGVSYWKPML